jgi:hypothetical protein
MSSGDADKVKSAPAVTETTSGTVWVREPEVAVSRMIERARAVFLPALNVVCSVVPGIKLVQEGLAVTPRGTPFIVTVTGDVKPLIPVRVSAIFWVAPPA